jgi:hypothetical protein
VLVNTNRSAATYSAFCRSYGNGYTKKAGAHNWNEEAIDKMVQDLAVPWENFCSTLQDRHESTSSSIEDLIDWAIDYISMSRES